MACGSDEDDGAPAGPSTGSSSSSGAGGSPASSGAGAATSSSSGAGANGGGGAGATGGEGGGTNGDFSCVGNVTWPVPAVGTISVELNVTAETIQGNNPLANITVKACAKADTACTVPLSTATTNANGEVTIEVPVTAAAGFDGYFDLTGANIPPSLVFVHPPPFEDVPPGSLTVPLVDNSTLDLLGLAGIDLDPARGTVALIGQDCMQEGASGLSFVASTEDAESTHLYVNNGLPNLGGTSTDATGVGAIFNVTAGPATVTSTIESSSTQVASIDIFTRAGTFSYATLPPTP